MIFQDYSELDKSNTLMVYIIDARSSYVGIFKYEILFTMIIIMD